MTEESVRADLIALQGLLYRAGLLEATQTVTTHRGPEQVPIFRI